MDRAVSVNDHIDQRERLYVSVPWVYARDRSWHCFNRDTGSCADRIVFKASRRIVALDLRRHCGSGASRRRSAQKEEAAGDGGFSQSRTRRYPYLSCVEMSLNLPLRVEPIVFTVAMITTEMPAAIRPYSIAVAPDSSFRNARTRVMGLIKGPLSGHWT